MTTFVSIFCGFIWVAVGVFFVWFGSIQIVLNAMPRATAVKVAEIHSRWMREHVFRAQPKGE